MPSPALTEDSLLGSVLGHYRITEKIGSGGMGVVYRAHDDHLDRDVAVKVLRPGTLPDESTRKHFQTEARALSRLNHPNIATIHDFDVWMDVDYLVMEYVPGLTLGEMAASCPLREKEILQFGAQIANGLATAHEHGIVHCDLKPGNVRVTNKGGLKILDFGLAKFRQPAAESDVTESVLARWAITGTLGYMAPEQVRGEEVDARSDIHAAGLVLYELATGRRAFEEVEVSELIAAILHRLPPPACTLNPRLSPELGRIIGKCMEKDPEDRYQSAEELAIDLRRLQTPTSVGPAVPAAGARKSKRLKLAAAALGFSAMLAGVIGFNAERILGHFAVPPSEPIQSIAVLPLANLSTDPQQDHFADGLTDALISELGQSGTLRVISRQSVMQYKNTDKSLPQIARELGVDAVIEGSVLHSKDRVRITVEMISARPERHLWTQSYERDLGNVLKLQSEVAQAIAKEIKAKTTSP